MRKLILILATILGITAFSYGQSAMDTYTIWNGGVAKILSQSDSITWSSGIKISGPETLDLIIPVKKTEGMMNIWGYTYSVSDTDTVYYSIAPHRGDYTRPDPNFTHSFVAMDTTISDSLAGAQFEVYPMSSSTLRAKACTYYDFKIYCPNSNDRTFYIKIEWIK